MKFLPSSTAIVTPTTATTTTTTTTMNDNDSSVIASHKNFVTPKDDKEVIMDSTAVTSSKIFGTVSAFLQRRWKATALIVIMGMMIVLFGMSIHFYKEASDLALKQEVILDAMNLEVEFLRNSTTSSSGCMKTDGNMTMDAMDTDNGSNGNGRELYVCPDADNVVGASRYSSTEACNKCNTYLTRLHGCLPGCRRSFDYPYRILRGGNIYCDCHCGWEGSWIRLYS
jgi:hypothetical protein